SPPPRGLTPRNQLHLGHVREREGLADTGDEAPHAREERVALVGRHRRDERRRRDAVAEVGGREPLLEREPPLLGRAEERARRERRPPRSLPLRDDGAAQRGEELLHPALHRVAEVAHVPEE